MRRDKVCIYGTIALLAWISMTYFLFMHRPSLTEAGGSHPDLNSLKIRFANFEHKLKEHIDQNNAFLEHLKDSLAKKQEALKPKLGKGALAEPSKDKAVIRSSVPAAEKVVIPILMFACNRVTVSKALDSLLKIRKDKEKFPIIVSQVRPVFSWSKLRLCRSIVVA